MCCLFPANDPSHTSHSCVVWKEMSWASFPGIGSLLCFVYNLPPCLKWRVGVCVCVHFFAVWAKHSTMFEGQFKVSVLSDPFTIDFFGGVVPKIWLSKQLFQRQRDLEAKPSKNRVARPGLWLLTKHRIQKVASTSLQQKCQVQNFSGKNWLSKSGQQKSPNMSEFN